MRYHVSFTESALSDLDALYSYIAFDLSSPETAEKLYRLILAEIEALQDFPFRCPQVSIESLHYGEIRRFSVKNYLVYYLASESDKQIIILRILHHLQDSQTILASLSDL